MNSQKRALARWVFQRWPIPVGLRFLIKTVPNPPPGIVTRGISGFPLRLKFNPQTYMGKCLYYRGIYEEAIVKRLRKFLKPGMSFIDVGANVGFYTVIAGHLVGNEGKVIAFEPQRDLVKLLRSNIEINRLTNVSIEAVALGVRRSEDFLYQVSKSNDGQATLQLNDDEQVIGQPIPVHVNTLDRALADKRIEEVHGIKIDVEGAEVMVLEGFREHLERRNRPKFIYVECIEQHLARFGNSSAELFSFLRGYEYRLWSLCMGRWRSMDGTNPHHSAHILAFQ